MKFRKIFSLLSLFILMAVQLFAQQTGASDVEMADQFRADGKIYVVVAVVLIVLVGIFVYLFRLDGKLGKLERELKNNK